jgi:hypothetical protein
MSISDCSEVDLSVEERLALAASRGALRDGQAADAETYGSVEDYDPVLRSHCRLSG